MSLPLSVSLVTYNGEKWLPGLLRSLATQSLSDFELLVVDNASTDATRRLLHAHARSDSRVAIDESDTNLGFAAAHNRNIYRARSEYVVLLNQDVELDADFLAAATAALDSRPDVGAVQGRLLTLAAPGQRTRTIDSTGLVMHRDRRVVARRQGEFEDDSDQRAGYVWGADGPLPVYRRAALLDVAEPRSTGGSEILDEDFFMYKEDVDLAWRLRKAGWRSWYEPRALAWHARSAGSGPARSMLDIARSSGAIPRWIKGLSWRNQRLMQLKNEVPAEYLRDLPWIVRRELLSFAFVALSDPLRLRSVGDFARSASRAVAKRRSPSAGA